LRQETVSANPSLALWADYSSWLLSQPLILFLEILAMSSIWDWFRFLPGLIHWQVGERRTAPERRNIRLQLESLENREVLSAALPVQQTTLSQTSQQTPPVESNPVALPVQLPSLSQTYQQMLQAASDPLASQAQPLLQMFTSVVSALPALSNGLNVVAINVSRYAGPQTAQQATQGSVAGVDTILMGLENVTAFALQAAGVVQDPTFNMDVALLNTFMSDPLNYPPPP
jgi:hypothetical protein